MGGAAQVMDHSRIEPTRSHFDGPASKDKWRDGTGEAHKVSGQEAWRFMNNASTSRTCGGGTASRELAMDPYRQRYAYIRPNVVQVALSSNGWISGSQEYLYSLQNHLQVNGGAGTAYALPHPAQDKLASEVRPVHVFGYQMHSQTGEETDPSITANGDVLSQNLLRYAFEAPVLQNGMGGLAQSLLVYGGEDVVDGKVDDSNAAQRHVSNNSVDCGIGHGEGSSMEAGYQSDMQAADDQTDLESFIEAATPVMNLKGPNDSIHSLCLEDVWKFYEEPSVYGRQVNLARGSRGQSFAYFVPYLSAMRLFVPASPVKTGSPTGSLDMYICDIPGWPKHMQLVYEYFEQQLPHVRQPFFQQMTELGEPQWTGGLHGPNTIMSKVIRELRLAEIHPASWFAVAWYPIYCIPEGKMTSRFLTFHTLTPHFSDDLDAQLACGQIRASTVGLKFMFMNRDGWLVPQFSLMDGGRHEDGTEQDSGQCVSRRDADRQLEIDQLHAKADQLARARGLRVLVEGGIEPARCWHPDFEFFDQRCQ